MLFLCSVPEVEWMHWVRVEEKIPFRDESSFRVRAEGRTFPTRYDSMEEQRTATVGTFREVASILFFDNCHTSSEMRDDRLLQCHIWLELPHILHYLIPLHSKPFPPFFSHRIILLAIKDFGETYLWRISEAIFCFSHNAPLTLSNAIPLFSTWSRTDALSKSWRSIVRKTENGFWYPP